MQLEMQGQNEDGRVTRMWKTGGEEGTLAGVRVVDLNTQYISLSR